MRWGLIPSWAKEEKVGFRMINARAETIDSKPAFKKLFKTRRCLVLADGFYEWRQDSGGKAKAPYRFVLREGRPFAMAGLWDAWSEGQGPALLTYTIITTSANKVVGRVHPRMPVILDARGRREWLDRAAGPERLAELLKPFDSSAMEGYRVSSGVNKPANDHENLILPVNEDYGLFR